MPGPHSKPTALRLLEGNPGKRPLNENEPQPARTIPPIPKHLDKIAKKRWGELAEYLHTLGILTAIDGDALAVYCQAYSDWVKIEKTLKEPDSDVQMKHTIDAAGNEFLEMKSNPRVRQKNELWKIMKAYLSEFGMTPSSRSRIGVKVKGQKDELEEFNL